MTSRNRHLTTAATLLAGVLVLGVMAVVGYRQLTEPFGAEEPAAQAEGCPDGQHEVSKKTLRRSEVKVSVYNAGSIKGAAGRTMAALERGGFQPGEVGNAPASVKARTPKVYTTKADDPAAQLVARYLGKGASVVHADEDFGPGVDVFIGKRLPKPNKKAAKTIRLKEPTTSCVADR
jgi:hypothetical protein